MSKSKNDQKSTPRKYLSQFQKFLLGGIFLVAVLLYSNTLMHEYALDDTILITENSFTQQGIQGIPDILRHDTFYGYFNEPGKADLVSGGRYRPLSQIMFALEYEVFGLNPFWGHLLNVLLYAITCCSVFLLTLILANHRFDKNASTWIAGAAALLFTIHPVHTEVVANIKGRDEILAMTCALWAALWLLGAKSKKGILFYMGGGILFFLALFAKEIAASFLIVIPMMSYFFIKCKPVHIFRMGGALLTAFISNLIVRISVLGLPEVTTPPMELMNNPFLIYDDGKYLQLSFLERVPNILYSLLRYVQLLFFPHPLTYDYYPRHIPLVDWSNLAVLLSAALFAGLFVSALWGWRKKEIWSFCVFYFLITIFLVSNILFPIGTNLSERFLFFPSFGWAVGMGLIITKYRKIRILNIIWVFFLLLFAVKTISRNPVWKDNFTLFTTDVETSANSAKAQNAAGGEIIARARSVRDSVVAEEYLLRSIVHLEKAIEIHPLYKNAFLLLGNAHYYLREFEKAISFYDRALEMDGNYKEALTNRAITWRDLGRYYGEKEHDLMKAIKYLEAAEDYLEDDQETMRLLGVAYGNFGNHEKAIIYFKKAIALNPEDATSYYNLSMAYFASGDEENGNKYLEQAKFLDDKLE